MIVHTKTAGFSPRRANSMLPLALLSEPSDGVRRPNNGTDEAKHEGSDHRVAERLQFHAQGPVRRSAAVPAGGLAILLHREVLLVGVAFSGRAHAAGRRVTVEAGVVAVERPRRLHLVGGKTSVTGGAVVSHRGRDRSNTKDKRGGDGGDTGLHDNGLAPLQVEHRIGFVSFCLKLRWSANFILDVTPRTRRGGLKILEVCR